MLLNWGPTYNRVFNHFIACFKENITQTYFWFGAGGGKHACYYGIQNAFILK